MMNTKSQTSTNKYRMIFDNANDGIIIHDLYGNILDVNRSMFKRLGYTKEEMLSMNLKDLVSPEFGKRIRERTQKLAKDRVAIFESQDKRKDGTFMPVEVSARIVEFNNKKAIQSIVRDISDRKIAEELIQSTMVVNERLINELKEIQQISRLIDDCLVDSLKTKSSETKSRSIQIFQKRRDVIDFIINRILNTPDIFQIDLREICRGLILFISNQNILEMKNRQLRFEFENIIVNFSQAIRSAYLLSELFRISFGMIPENRPLGIFVISARENSKLELLIEYKPTRGEKDDFSTLSDTKEMRFVKSLIRQFRGSMRIKTGSGFEISVILPDMI